MPAPLVPTLRLGAFAFVILASVIILALCAHITHTTETLLGGYFAFSALGIATSLLALFTLPVMLVIDNMRKGAVTSMIIAEIAWLGTLWILFLSTAATASQAATFSFGDRCSSRFAIYTTTCHEFGAVQAFAHLAWIVLFAYLALLVVFSINLANRGHSRVWYQSVKETEFNAPPVNAPVAPMVVAPMAVPAQQYIPAQNTGVYPPQPVPQASPVPGFAGTPSPAPYTHQSQV
ncbi:hypothetical protein H0H92_013313 [Tricholoma furcatifolium]|nr:hypothetical protein H0H92_013313 [Tricholoma furcatifolium]